MSNLVVASHNQMKVRDRPGLIAHYRALGERRGLHVLALQESAGPDRTSHAPAIARGLGPQFRALDEHAGETGQAIVYDHTRVRPAEVRHVPLRRLRRMRRVDRWVLGADEASQQTAQVVAFEPVGAGAAFTVVNFHLDCVGEPDHRRSQLEGLVLEIARARWPRATVLCGDTNAFAWRRQLAALRWLLAPLAALGAHDVGERPTHWFARAREEPLSHRVAVALGRVGVDLPHRYDVVCANRPVTAHGQRTTPESDHDLVWAAIAA